MEKVFFLNSQFCPAVGRKYRHVVSIVAAMDKLRLLV